MKHFISILLTTLIFPNVTNNGAEITIPDNVSVTISGDLTLNSGDFVVDGSLLVSGNIFYNGGIIMGQGLLNNSQLTLGDLTQDGSRAQAVPIGTYWNVPSNHLRFQTSQLIAKPSVNIH